MQDQTPEKLILKYLSKEASEKEVEALYNWLERDPGNADVFQEYQQAYNEKYGDKIDFDAGKGLEALNRKIDDHKAVSTFVASRRWWYGIAAGLVILTIALANFYLNTETGDRKPVYFVKQNPMGQKSVFRLSDGSVIRLNAGSSLRYPEVFSENERRVVLSGEAFFDVASDKNKPFVVVSKGLVTTVLGTSFNIRSYGENDKAAVIVASGKVKVENNVGGTVILLPEEQATFDRETKKITKGSVNLERMLAWKDNTLWFENDPLVEVAGQLEKWYDVNISFKDNAVKDCLLTGRFRNENLTNVLKAIKISTGIHYERNNKQIIISGNGCK